MKQFKIIQSNDSDIFTKEVQAFVNTVEKAGTNGMPYLRPVYNIIDIQYAAVQSATSRVPLYTALITYTER